MARPATSRLKVNAPLGRMPVLQFCAPGELRIDPAYQRDISSGPSQTLIRRIAQFWNWDLCQPLVVARRSDLTERLFVIDGQHRLEAARLRSDIPQLPCVIVDFANTADEAASFVHLNQQRRPLSKLDVFKAAVASGDQQSCAIVAALTEAGLSVAPHSNHTVWKPGMLQNIGGIENAWRVRGEAITRRALRILAEAYQGEILRYAGTIFPGIVHVIAMERQGCDADEVAINDAEFMPGFADVVAATPQTDWVREIVKLAPDVKGGRREAAQVVMWAAWQEFLEAYFEEDELPAEAA